MSSDLILFPAALDDFRSGPDVIFALAGSSDRKIGPPLASNLHVCRRTYQRISIFSNFSGFVSHLEWVLKGEGSTGPRAVNNG